MKLNFASMLFALVVSAVANPVALEQRGQQLFPTLSMSTLTNFAFERRDRLAFGSSSINESQYCQSKIWSETSSVELSAIPLHPTICTSMQIRP